MLFKSFPRHLLRAYDAEPVVRRPRAHNHPGGLFWGSGPPVFLLACHDRVGPVIEPSLAGEDFHSGPNGIDLFFRV